MLRLLVARMPLTLINGWRWRTHVAVLMRQFVQFCKKTMAVHFIAMCLLGYISTATSFRSEEFRPAINQRTPLYQRSAPYFSFFNGTCVVCGSIQMQSLKSASFFFALLIIHSLRLVMPLRLVSPSGCAESQLWSILSLCSKHHT